MKSSNNQIIRILYLVFVAALMAGAQKSILADEAVPADNTTGSGATAAINDYQFQGTATLNINGQEKSADLLVTVLAEPEVDATGVHHVVATHTFTFADGSSITTSDEEIAEPTATPGLYALTANMQVVSGTDIYEGVRGQLAANGTMDFAAQPPTAQFELAGAILEDTTGSGSTAAINDYQFAGTATLNIHGQEKSADLLVTVLAEPEVDANGVHHVVATHTFTFADGSSITTSDEEIAEPTATPGLYTLTANMQIVSGTGIYEWVSGKLAAYGTMDFAAQPPAAQFELAGAILEDTTGSGSTAAINENQFEGTATLTIHGQEKSTDLLITVLAEPEIDANGMHHVVATHTCTFADGSSFTTSDEEIAEPTATPGLYTLTAHMEVVSGTGIYEGISGLLAAYGTIDFAAQPPAAQFDIYGAVAFCGDVNHPYPVGDVNQDCNVNVLDFALMASHWLDCTYPNSN